MVTVGVEMVERSCDAASTTAEATDRTRPGPATRTFFELEDLRSEVLNRCVARMRRSHGPSPAGPGWPWIAARGLMALKYYVPGPE